MDVLVAGAGIAGLATAIAVAGTGHRVVVAERRPELGEIGAALSIWPNALAALDHLGLGEQVRAVGVEAPTASIRAASGRPIARFDTEAMRRALGGLPLVVLRAGLQKVLLEECARLGVEIRLSQVVVGVSPDGSRVTAELPGCQRSFDAVVGADGINSKVRAAVSDPDARRDCDRIAWRAVVPNRDGLVSDAWLTVGVGRQLIAAPAPDGYLYWAADTPGRDLGTAGDRHPSGVLERCFGDWHPPIRQLIERTPAEALIVNRIYDRRPPRRLSQDRILLVGDAAHAMTPDLGQGACQAIEDAAVLLACLRSDPSADAPVTFQRFERVRLRRVRQMVRDSYGLGRLATTPSRSAAAARDSLTRLLPETVNNRRLAAYASEAAFARQMARAGA